MLTRQYLFFIIFFFLYTKTSSCSLQIEQQLTHMLDHPGGAMHGFGIEHKTHIRLSLTALAQTSPSLTNHYLKLINQKGAMNGFTEKHKVQIVTILTEAPSELSLALLDSFDYKGFLHTQTEEQKMHLLQSIRDITISETLQTSLKQYPDVYSSVLFYLFSSQFKLDFCLPLESRLSQLPHLIKNMVDHTKLINILVRNPRFIAEKMWLDLTEKPLYKGGLIGHWTTLPPSAFD